MDIDRDKMYLRRSKDTEEGDVEIRISYIVDSYNISFHEYKKQDGFFFQPIEKEFVCMQGSVENWVQDMIQILKSNEIPDDRINSE
jgi:hypothetical protein